MKKLLAVIKLADKLGFDLSKLTALELIELSIEIKKCFKNAVDKPDRKLYKVYTIDEEGNTLFLNEEYLTEEQVIAYANNPHIYIYER